MQPTDELGKFLAAQAARLNAEADAAPTCNGYSRRINGSRWVTNPDGSMTHWSVTHEASNDEEAWCQRHDPLRGLNAEGIKAYERKHGPQTPFKRLLARLNQWAGQMRQRADIALSAVFNRYFQRSGADRRWD